MCRRGSTRLHHGADYAPYEELHITGLPTLSILRGTVVMEGGEPTALSPGGRYVVRDSIAPNHSDRLEVLRYELTVIQMEARVCRN